MASFCNLYINRLSCGDNDAAAAVDVGIPLEPECAAELKSVRRGLLEDYRISPSVEQSCAADVSTHCDGVARRDVIHCLMDVARHQARAVAEAAANNLPTATKQLSTACYQQVCVCILIALRAFCSHLSKLVWLGSPVAACWINDREVAGLTLAQYTAR